MNPKNNFQKKISLIAINARKPNKKNECILYLFFGYNHHNVFGVIL